MKRQTLRKALILISFFLFPITIFYFSPVIIIMGVTQGVIAGSFVLFILLFLSALFLGRAFCGWVCPGAGLQECCLLVVKKNPRKLDWIKYVIWIPWITTIIMLAIKAGGFRRIDIFYHIKYGLSLTEPISYIIYYSFVGLIVILAFTAGKRAFCHYICWMAPFMVIGNKFREWLKLPALQLKSQQDKCVKCKLCNRNCQMSLDVESMVLSGSMKNSECILCGECVDVCAKGAIKYSFGLPKNK
jgi:polyferredoxin